MAEIGNPFVAEMVNSLRVERRKMRTGKESQMVNTATGEIVGGQHSYLFRRVDTAVFIKLYPCALPMMFNLNRNGHQVLSIFFHIIKMDDSDLVELTYPKALATMNEMKVKKICRRSFYAGLNDLITHKFIAKSGRQGKFYLNCNFIFNGNRIDVLDSYLSSKYIYLNQGEANV